MHVDNWLFTIQGLDNLRSQILYVRIPKGCCKEVRSYSYSCTVSNKSYAAQNVTEHEKTGLMYTKYTSPYYETYLLYCSRYLSSVNCIRLPMKCRINSGNFIRLLLLSAKLLKFEIQKCGQILCAHKPYFLMPGHKSLWFCEFLINHKSFPYQCFAFIQNRENRRTKVNCNPKLNAIADHECSTGTAQIDCFNKIF